jgi:hypothetical protein
MKLELYKKEEPKLIVRVINDVLNQHNKTLTVINMTGSEIPLVTLTTDGECLIRRKNIERHGFVIKEFEGV